MTLQEYNDIYKLPIRKSMTITSSSGVTITNTNIVSEKMSLEKSLCSEDNLRYGRCEAACFKITIADISHDFTGETLYVVQDVETDGDGYLITENGLYILTEDGERIILGEQEKIEAQAVLGYFKVFSDKPTNDRRWRELTCYDAMYDILNADVATWYNGLTFPMTIKNLRDSFFTYLGITQETVTLVNDSFVTMGGFSVVGTLSGKTVIEAICELNGVFGQITPSGTFDYVSLTDAETLTLDYYVDGTGSYEDYTTDYITGINARGTATDVGTFVGTDTNIYVIENNPLIYGTEGTQALETALGNLLDQIETDTFRPFTVQTYGNPMLPLGTKLTIVTRNITIVSHVLRKKMTGIQALRDKYTATSEKSQPALVNNATSDIKRTKGKVHELEVDVNGLTSRVSDTEANLANNYSTTTQMNSAITQAVDSIETIVSTATSKYDTTGLTIDYFGYGAPSSTLYPPADNNGKHYLDNNSGQVYVCNGSTWSASGNPLTLITSEISSQLTQLSGKVAVKVNSSGRLVTVDLGVDPASSTSYVKVKADDIDIISNGNIQLTGKSIGISSTNFSVTSAGVVTCSNITATGGSIGGWDISSTDLHKIFASAGYGVKVSSGIIGRYETTYNTIECGFDLNNCIGYAKEGYFGKLSASGAYYIDGTANVFHGDTSFPSGNIKINKLVPVSGSEVNINDACLFNSNGNAYVTGSLQLGSASSTLNCGIEIFGSGTPYIDFHLNHSSADFTARIVHRAASSTNYVDFVASSSTWIDCRAKSFANQSSKYVKKNIKNITETEAKKLLELRPVKFDYKFGGAENQRGLIAEEVNEIMPEMVIGADAEFNKDEPWNTPSIDYSKFVPYLIKMIQIQQKEIDSLKK